MGRKGNWFCSVNKALGCPHGCSVVGSQGDDITDKPLGSESCENKDKRLSKLKKKWSLKKKKSQSTTPPSSTVGEDPAIPPTAPPSPPQLVVAPAAPTKDKVEDVKPNNSIEPAEVIEKPKQVDAPKVTEIETVVEDAKSTFFATKIAVDGKSNRFATKVAEVVAVATEQAKPNRFATKVAEVVAVTDEPVKVHSSESTRFTWLSKEETAAIKIQTAFRVYLAKRALRALRGLSMLKHVMHIPAIKSQTANTLKSMQTLARVQTHIRTQRVKISDENVARQQKLLNKQAKEYEKSQKEVDWDQSLKSKEQVQAKMKNKHEAAVKRERAIAYSLTQQQAWKSSSPSNKSPRYMDSTTNPNHRGWSWLERWLAARPWETADTHDAATPDFTYLKSSFLNPISSPRGSPVAKALLYHASSGKLSPTSSHSQSPRASPRRKKPCSTSTLATTTPGRFSTSTSKPRPSTVTSRRTTKPEAIFASPKQSPRVSVSHSCVVDDDERSVGSLQSDKDGPRASSVGGDDEIESFASSPTIGSMVKGVPSYMAPTESAKARSRLGSSQAVVESSKQENADRSSVSSAKKRLTYPSSPAMSRRSVSSITDDQN